MTDTSLTVVRVMGNDVSTDVIYPGRYMATVLPQETPKYCFADDTDFNRQLTKGEIPKGSVLAAGTNFGCGSSREQAVSALHGHGLVVIAKGFARIFLRNAINVGLRIIICPTLEANDGDVLRVHPDRVEIPEKAKIFPVTPLPLAQQAIIDAGGLIPYVRKLFLERKGKGAL